MMTIRFPSGFSIQYNDAKFAERREHYTDLYTSSDEKTRRWIAQVPTQGCVVEVVQPCRVYDAIQSDPSAASALLSALNDSTRRSRIDSHTLKRIKAALQSFNSNTRRWRS